jgi:response regulator RpfG family c-di-GMP phosphodiesterase
MSQAGVPAPRTVTLVDNDPSALEALVQAASSWRYQCQAARSAEEALELLQRRLTPSVVTALKMPGRGGVWLVHEIQRRWPDVSIIVLTSGQDGDAVRACLSAGAHHFFLKPIQLDEFRHVLEATSRVFQQQRAREEDRQRLEQALRQRSRLVRRTFSSGVHSLVRTLEARDPCTCGHSLRVRDYVLNLADFLGWDRRQQRRLSLVARLHDIGKVALPESVLNKPDVLSDEEQFLVREHPVLGERILTPILRSRAVLAGIRGHHERFDGSGYPDGLAGERIPVLARAVAVADCFDALTSARSYRAAIARREALEYLRAGAGTQFDPAFVLPFVERFSSPKD